MAVHRNIKSHQSLHILLRQKYWFAATKCAVGFCRYEICFSFSVCFSCLFLVASKKLRWPKYNRLDATKENSDATVWNCGRTHLWNRWSAISTSLACSGSHSKASIPHFPLSPLTIRPPPPVWSSTCVPPFLVWVLIFSNVFVSVLPVIHCWQF